MRLSAESTATRASENGDEGAGTSELVELVRAIDWASCAWVVAPRDTHA